MDVAAPKANGAGNGRQRRVVLIPRCWNQVLRNTLQGDGGKKSPVAGESAR